MECALSFFLLYILQVTAQSRSAGAEEAGCQICKQSIRTEACIPAWSTRPAGVKSGGGLSDDGIKIGSDHALISFGSSIQWYFC